MAGSLNSLASRVENALENSSLLTALGSVKTDTLEGRLSWALAKLYVQCVKLHNPATCADCTHPSFPQRSCFIASDMEYALRVLHGYEQP